MEKIHRIITTEQVTIEYPIAGIGSRGIALLIDQLIIFAVEIVIAVGFFAASGFSTSFLNPLTKSTSLTYAVALLILFIFLFPLFYFVLLESLWAGRTIGKKAMRLRVISYNGQSVSFLSALLRNVLRTVDALPTGYLLGMILIFSTKREQRLGDLAAGTIVVIDRAFAQKPAQGVHPAVSVGAMALSVIRNCRDDDKQLIVSFIDREQQWKTQRREALAKAVLARIARRLPEEADDLRTWLADAPALERLRELAEAESHWRA